ncbi:M20/M25/M40 family metallo-hydrolase [Fervidicella metallireducens]|uniref:M20/M25/M40 family metallo-hydrolase n=1 Tax=Fervidicella metallireducens TaxID=655338 RepID=UPI0006851FAF|nr:M20/M25/M40 family metallo-hydrolase [Fervidicella metallireducens]
MNELIELAKNYHETMISIRRQLHMKPEIDRDLKETADLVESYLKNNAIKYKRFNNNGIIAEVGTNYNNIVALRADMDALEIVDLKDVPYKSTKHGLMHACGHDAHTAILLGAAFA